MEVANAEPNATARSGERTYAYRDPTSLVKWTRWSLYAQFVVAAISIYSGFALHKVLNGLSEGAYLSQAEAMRAAEAIDSQEQLVALLSLGVFIWSGVMILRWIHRANWNARALGATGLTYTPGWAVGYYFIPLLFLWKPYGALKETWKASSNPENWQSQSVPALFPLWWTLWLVWNALGNAAFRNQRKGDDIDQLISTNVLEISGEVAALPLLLVFLLLLNKLQARQDVWAASAGLLGGRGDVVSR